VGLPVRNIRKKDEREHVLENFETCLSREECAPQFSERIHKQKKRSESSRGTHPLLRCQDHQVEQFLLH
jgi:hypothetical protein